RQQQDAVRAEPFGFLREGDRLARRPARGRDDPHPAAAGAACWAGQPRATPSRQMIAPWRRQVSTAVRTTWPYSLATSEKNSPVPPAANSAVAPYGTSHSSRAAYERGLKLPSTSKSVIGKE